MAFNVDNRAKPILKWAGGKTGLLTQLMERFPKQFERYIEPFVGGGAVFFSLQSGFPSILNDSNSELIELYKVVRDFPEQLMTALDELSQKYSEDFYYDLRNAQSTDRISRSARTIFLNKTGFNGLYRINLKGNFNVPFGKRKKCPALYKRDNVLAISRRFQKATFSNEDFETSIAQAGEGDFVYCDPPYQPISCTSSFNSYTAGGFSTKQQKRLKNACVDAAKRGAKIALSNSSAPFIRELYSDWHLHSVTARRAINSKGNLRGEIEEVLATSYPLSESQSLWPATKAERSLYDEG